MPTPKLNCTFGGQSIYSLLPDPYAGYSAFLLFAFAGCFAVGLIYRFRVHQDLRNHSTNSGRVETDGAYRKRNQLMELAMFLRMLFYVILLLGAKKTSLHVHAIYLIGLYTIGVSQAQEVLALVNVYGETIQNSKVSQQFRFTVYGLAGSLPFVWVIIYVSMPSTDHAWFEWVFVLNTIVTTWLFYRIVELLMRYLQPRKIPRRESNMQVNMKRKNIVVRLRKVMQLCGIQILSLGTTMVYASLCGPMTDLVRYTLDGFWRLNEGLVFYLIVVLLKPQSHQKKKAPDIQKVKVEGNIGTKIVPYNSTKK